MVGQETGAETAVEETPAGIEPTETEATSVPEGETPDAPTEAAPPPDAPSAEGTGRDPATGRFVPKNGTAGGPQDQIASEPFVPTPFKVKYNRQEHEVIPGALIREDGLLVPKDHIEKAHEMFGRALAFEAQRAEMREQLVRARQSESTAKATEAALEQEIGRLFEIAAMPDEEQMAVAAVEYILNLRQQRPLLEERIKLNRERAEFDLQRELQAPEPEQQREAIVQQVTHTAQEHLRSFVPYLEGLTDEDQQTLLQRVIEDPERYAYRVGPKLNAREREAGVQPGEIVFDADALYRDAQLAHQYRQRIIGEAKQREAAVAATQRNTQREKAPVAPPPPPPPAPEVAAVSAPTRSASADDGDREARRDHYLRSMGMLR